MPVSPSPSPVVPLWRVGWCPGQSPGWAACGLSREAHRAGAMPPPAARRRPGAAEQTLPLPPSGRRTAFFGYFFFSFLFFSLFLPSPLSFLPH